VVVPSLSEVRNLIVQIYLSWLYFAGEVLGKGQY
jgi:hypothetical protein